MIRLNDHKGILKTAKWNKLILFLPLVLILFLTQIGFGQEGNNWNIYRGNQQLTGYTQMTIPSELSVLWSFKTEDEIKGSPVVYDDKIVFGSTDGSVYCLESDGEFCWKFETGNSIESSALVLDDKVFIGNLEGILYALRLDDGQKIWEYKTENQIMASPNWWRSGENTFILVGSYDYYLHCVNASSGQAIWQYELNNYLNSAVAIDGNKAVFGGCDGFLHVIDLAKGSAIDQFDLASYIAGSPVLIEDMALTGDYDGQVSCVSLSDKKIMWSWTNEDSDLPIFASPAVYGEKVVIGSRDKNVYCFDIKSGDLIWKTPSGSRIDASPVISGEEVLVANMRGDLILINLLDGNVRWTYETGNAVFSNPVIFNNKILVGSSDGSLYCLGE